MVTLKCIFSDHLLLDDGNDEYPDDNDQNTLTSDDMCLGRGRSPSQERSGRKRMDRHGLADFVFIKVLGKGSFGKVCNAHEEIGIELCLSITVSLYHFLTNFSKNTHICH